MSLDKHSCLSNNQEGLFIYVLLGEEKCNSRTKESKCDFWGIFMGFKVKICPTQKPDVCVLSYSVDEFTFSSEVI